MDKVVVSIVIVCMNNLKFLYPCLKSIQRFTNISYEVLVTAYLFSSENLKKVRSDFPWVKFIESNEIRGFSENNNLALKYASGEYCFILNDDTELFENVVDKLVSSIRKLSDNVAVLSPVVYRPNGSVQHSGRGKYNLPTLLLDYLGLFKWYEEKSGFVNKKGVFKSYNIHGAAFLIKTNIFRKFGFFDERYFFCPEDIALSTALNKEGFYCYVDDDIRITHYGGGTWSKTIVATKPATVKGQLMFYGENCWYKSFAFRVLSFLFYGFKFFYWKTFGKLRDKEKSVIMSCANGNAVYALFSKKTPKELFVKFFDVNKYNKSK